MVAAGTASLPAFSLLRVTRPIELALRLHLPPSISRNGAWPRWRARGTPKKRRTRGASLFSECSISETIGVACADVPPQAWRLVSPSRRLGSVRPWRTTAVSEQCAHAAARGLRRLGESSGLALPLGRFMLRSLYTTTWRRDAAGVAASSSCSRAGQTCAGGRRLGPDAHD